MSIWVNQTYKEVNCEVKEKECQIKNNKNNDFANDITSLIAG